MFDERTEWQRFKDLLFETLAKVFSYAMLYGVVLTLPFWLWITNLIWG